MDDIRIERLNDRNFADYERLTACQSEGGCYCSFWHQKWTSMDDWVKCQKETPEYNRGMVLEKMRSGFHVGVLAYQGDQLVAWVSVGPLIDFYWTWKRTIHVGEDAKYVAGIVCFTMAEELRGRGLQAKVLEALKEYGRGQGWKSIEGYPFDAATLEKQKENAIWPGMARGFERAGFSRVGPHWLSGPDWERSIYSVTL